MIEFEPGEDTQILLDAVTRFARDHLAERHRTAERDRSPAAGSQSVYEELGLMGLETSGEGLGLVTRALVNEQLGQADAGAALALDRLGAAGYAFQAVDNRETLDNVLADPARRAWLVTPEDGAVNVSEREATGMVHFAPAGVTDLVMLSPAGIAVVREGLVETPVRGAGLRAMNPVTLTLENAPVARFHRAAPTPVLARARLYVASLLLGVLEAASRYAREYAMERITFGRPIAHHQALTFLLTDMNTAVASTRLLIQEAAWRADAGEPFEEAAATAFAEAVEQSAFIGPAGVQVLGGLGFMQDYPVEKYMREARALGLLYGGLDRAREDAMREHGTELMAGGLI